jgi:hypothetical protein
MIFLVVLLQSSNVLALQNLYLNRVGFCDVEVGYDVHVVGNKAYVTNNDGLMIINTQDPRNPYKAGELLIGGCFGFVINGSIAYIASVLSGFVIANLSNAQFPEPIWSDSTSGANKVAISGDLAYVSYIEGGFNIFNITNPESPSLIGTFSGTRSDSIQVKDNYVYFADAEVGLKIIDVSNPSNPFLVQTLSQTGGANDIHISDNILYLARWGMGIKVFNISNPTSPLALDSYDDDDGGEELGLVEKDGLLYVADNSGVELFNVSNPNSIFEIAQLTRDVGAAHEIDVDHEYIYVALGGGLLILEVSNTPQEIDLLIYLIIISVGVAGILILAYLMILKRKKKA